MSKSFALTQSKGWKLLAECIRWLMIACSVISTGCMVYSVVLRYVFKGNFYGSDEVIMLFASGCTLWALSTALMKTATLRPTC